jgi:hypothetical protein
MRELAGESALKCWRDLAKDRIMSTWDFDDTHTEDASEDSDTDDDDTFINVDDGHDDLEKIDLMMIVDRDDDKKSEHEKNGDEK